MIVWSAKGMLWLWAVAGVAAIARADSPAPSGLRLTRLENGILRLTVTNPPAGRVCRVLFAPELGLESRWTVAYETSASESSWVVRANYASGYFRLDTISDPAATSTSTVSQATAPPTPAPAAPWTDSILPRLSMVAGDFQRADGGALLPVPLTVAVRDPEGSPLAGTPVTFAVVNGGGLLAATAGGSETENLVVPSDAEGQARAWFRLPRRHALCGIAATVALDGQRLAVRFSATTLEWARDLEIVALDAGYAHSLALARSGRVWAWGANNHGQVGDGTTMNRGKPVLLDTLSNIVAIAAGNFHNVALRADGTVWTWGNNCCGQIGNNTFASTARPIQVPLLNNVAAIAAGGHRVVASRADGSVFYWGDYAAVPLNDHVKVPTRKSNVTPLRAAAAGYWHTLGQTESGVVWQWGPATGEDVGNHPPYELPALAGALALAAGARITLGLMPDGLVWEWSDTSALRPALKAGLSGISAISVSEDPAGLRLAADHSGQLWAWSEVSSLPARVANGWTGIQAISAGGKHYLAHLADGSLWAWGDNSAGQLGHGHWGGASAVPVSVQFEPSLGDASDDLALEVFTPLWSTDSGPGAH